MSATSVEDTDFCYTCDADTAWSGEVCTGCHRIWGYERDFCDCSESYRNRGEHTPGCLAGDSERDPLL